MLIWSIAVVVVAVAGAAVYFRTVPSAPDRWHVDPLVAEAPTTPNAWRVGPAPALGPEPDVEAPVYDLSADALARKLDAMVMAEPRTERLAQSQDGLWVTYVQRSRVMGFPDYMSVRVIPRGEDAATLSIFSRSRYGQSDLGVNRARVENWLAGLSAFAR